MPLGLVSWNLQGSHSPDLEAVAEVLRGFAPDVVLLQEVQRRQARRLAELLEVPHRTWAFKHHPIVHPPEGMAVLSRLPLTVRRIRLTWAPPWSWRRRTAIVATVRGEEGSLVVANLHLSPHQLRLVRLREVARVVGAVSLARGSGTPVVIVGDLNDHPGSEVLGTFRAAGWRDAWQERHPGAQEPDGATNWRDDLPREGPPQQRIDFVLVDPRVDVVRIETVDPASPGFERFPALSDHLPLHAVLAPLG